MSHDVTRGPDVEVPSLERLTLSSSAGVEVALVPHAGLVVTSMTLDGVELLARRRGLAHYLASGSTYGIPLLAPWANRLSAVGQRVGEVAWDVRVGDPRVHPDDVGQAMHGLLAGAPEWVVEDVGADHGSAWLRARLRFDERLDCFASFPFAHDLDVEVRLVGLCLRITTALTATGAGAVPVAFGWHPWFAFPDVPREEWVLDVPFTSRATLTDLHVPTGEVLPSPIPAGPLVDLVLDDLFVDVAPGSRASVRGGVRSVTVDYVSGYDVAVVFAPRELDVVCIEPMTAPTDPFTGWWPLRTAVPGETVEAVVELTAGRH
jgi:galactose mutarotase-like enzyme